MTSSHFCTNAVVETSLAAQLQSLQPHYVTGGRKIDVLLCSLYIQHRRGGNIFVSPSLSHCSLVYNMISGRIPPMRSLWKLLCQSSDLIKCIFFLIHFSCWEKSTGAHRIFIHLPLSTGSIIQSLCTESSNFSFILC